MKLNSFNMPHSNSEPQYSPAPSMLQNYQRVVNVLNASTKLTISNEMLALAYTTDASPGQRNPRFASLMNYEKSRSHPHANVSIEPWSDASLA